jgi:ApbE superfamily uncharacterized protein (UPF0280 family)
LIEESERRRIGSAEDLGNTFGLVCVAVANDDHSSSAVAAVAVTITNTTTTSFAIAIATIIPTAAAYGASIVNAVANHCCCHCCYCYRCNYYYY